MNERRTPTGPHMAAYMYLQTLLAHGVRVEPGVWPAQTECTRCGGNHAPSECRRPLIQQDNATKVIDP
jgi:hypothetical protein